MNVNVRLFGGRGDPGWVLTAGVYTSLGGLVPAILTALSLTSYSVYERRPVRPYDSTLAETLVEL